MNSSSPLLVLGVMILIAGCNGASPADKETEGGGDVPPPTFPVECQVLGPDQTPLLTATCVFVFSGTATRRSVDASGKAAIDIAAGANGEIKALAPEHETKEERVSVDGAKRITFTLQPTGKPTQAASGKSPPDNATGTLVPNAPPSIPRVWSRPLAVHVNGPGGHVSEPMLDIAPSGTILYAPNSYGQGPFRSQDGGLSFEDLAAKLDQTMPTLRSDTSVDVTPDGTIWYARSILDLTNVMACSSEDDGNTWACNEWAMPGPTDRMWIVGVNSQVAYLQALLPQVYVAGPIFAYYHAWFKTTDGGATWLPYATTQDNAFPSGNMVFDEVSGKVMQVERVDDKLAFIHVDQGVPVIDWKKGDLDDTSAIPWMSAYNGTLWTATEPKRPDGSRGLVLARSQDETKTWSTFVIPTETGTVAFSYVSAGPEGRVAAVYYGSEVAKAPDGNGGLWAVYVVETSNGLDQFPTWTETRVVEKVHEGSLCVSADCEMEGDDPYARFSLDLIGIKVDGSGNAHIAYVSDLDGHVIVNWHARQRIAGQNPVIP